LAQSEQQLRQAFEGQYVVVKMDMPATQLGIDLYPERDPTIDFKVHYLDRTPAPPPEKFGDDPCEMKPTHTHDLHFGTDWKRRLHQRHGDR
jgi:hypothetical protein